MRLLSAAVALAAFALPAAAPAAQNTNCNTNLQTQAAVDAFDCKAIGTLRIGGSVTDLSGLSELEVVTAELRIESTTALTSLQGLENLVGVGTLIILSNQQLTSLSGLDRLATVINSMFVTRNPRLTSLEGLGSLVGIRGSLTISNNQALTSLDGLESFTTIGNLIVQNNTQLINVNALANLSLVLGTFDVRFNTRLADCSVFSTLIAGEQRANIVYGNLVLQQNAGNCRLGGFPITSEDYAQYANCQSIIRSNAEADQFQCRSIRELTIEGNVTDLSGLSEMKASTIVDIRSSQLQSLQGLGNLNSVGGGLYVRDNQQLTSLSGLDSFTFGGATTRIFGNTTLVSVDGLEAFRGAQSNLIIADNPALQEVDALAELGYVPELRVQRNPELANCAVGLGPIATTELAFPLRVPGEFRVANNDPNGDCNSIQSIADAFAMPPVTLPLAGTGLTAPGGDLILPAGRGQVRVTASATFTGETGQRFTVFVRLDGPGGYSRIAKRGEIKPQPGQTVSQSIKFGTTAADPAGAYTVTLLAAEGSVPISAAGDAEVLATLPATKLGGAGLRAAEALTAYPNPATDQATLRFAVAEAGPATLAVYDALGREVARPVDGDVEGTVETSFDASALPAGLYVARLKTPPGTETVRLTVVR